MSAIAGVLNPGNKSRVKNMLDRMKHRGPAGQEIIETGHATLGVAWTRVQAEAAEDLRVRGMARDFVDDGHFALAHATDKGVFLQRDPLGASPLYIGKTEDGELCFASEVKALIGLCVEIREFLPGHKMDGQEMIRYYQLEVKPPLRLEADEAARELRRRLEASVQRCVEGGDVGSWLSGGLDSSAIVALARPHLNKFHTFSAGLEGAPDLQHARIVAEALKTQHHEVKVDVADMLAVLPDVIYHLESFDALLVRSSITNYLVGRLAADYVPEVLSGEGGDELFAGYMYLKSLKSSEIAHELVDITGRLHNTALQRVDRSSSTFGTLAHVPLLGPEVVPYALQIPPEYKLHKGVEKWIFRQAMSDALPEIILTRTKSKFWEGAGVKDTVAEAVEERISDDEFNHGRQLPNGIQLNTKEELFYYRIFKEHFGELEDLSWMGRTKGAPVA